ncbi:MAG TPA: azurin [Steroidobacteraceae bacterium]|nr:azurin [Steroidobacteraceae bacterium]
MKLTLRSIAICSLLAIAGNAFGADKVCKLEITGTDAMQFDKKELSVAADCTQVELTLHHSGKLPAQAMGHNWVLTKSSDMAGVVSDGAAASFANDHIKPGDARVIAHTKIVGGGQSTSVTFPTSKLTKGGAYMFFCSFPGHSSLMKGTFKFG